MARKKQEPEEQTVLLGGTDPNEEAIHLLDLQIRNFRAIRFAHIKVDEGGKIIWITGKNEAGKTSVLDAIHSLTEGGRAVPDAAMNDTAPPGEQSYVKGKYSNNFTVVRKFTEKAPKGYLTVVGPDGGTHKQGKLDEWLEGVSGDPMHLWSLPSDRMLKVLLSLTDQPDAEDTLKAFDQRVEGLKETRRPHNSIIQAAERSSAPDGERPQRVDVSAEAEKLQGLNRQAAELQEAYAAVQSAERNLADSGKALAALAETVANLKAQLSRAEAELADGHAVQAKTAKAVAEAQASFMALKNPADEILRVEATIRGAKAKNEACVPWELWEQQQKGADEARVYVAELNEKIAKIEAAKALFVSSIKTTVPGLTFTDTMAPLLYGRELHAASGAQKARFQVHVMFAKNPKLKIILLDEGAALDGDYIKHLYEEAVARNFHIWICSIIEGHDTEFKVVEGRVA